MQLVARLINSLNRALGRAENKAQSVEYENNWAARLIRA